MSSSKTLVPLVLISLFSCENTPDFAEERKALVESIVSDFLLPRYQASVAGSQALQSAIDALCESPEADKIAEARQAWWDARKPWKETEMFNFGPYSEEPQRFGPAIDAWPARPLSVNALLSDSVEISAESVLNGSVYNKGFPAIEVLLYESSDVADFGERRCEYLKSASKTLGDDLQHLYEAWGAGENAFSNELIAPGTSEASRYISSQDALGEIINRLGFAAENLRVDKLGVPVESSSIDLLESYFSGRTAEDMRDLIRGIETIYFGNATVMGLREYLALRGASFEDEMRQGLDRCQEAIDEIDGPVAQTIIDGPDRIRVAMEAFRQLQLTIQNQLLPAAGLLVDFNDTDGD